MEQNGESRNKPLYLQSNNFPQMCHDNSMELRILFSTNGPGNNWISTFKRMKLDPYFILYTKVNPNKNLSIRVQTILFLEENNGKSL